MTTASILNGLLKYPGGIRCIVCVKQCQVAATAGDDVAVTIAMTLPWHCGAAPWRRRERSKMALATSQPERVRCRRCKTNMKHPGLGKLEMLFGSSAGACFRKATKVFNCGTTKHCRRTQWNRWSSSSSHSSTRTTTSTQGFGQLCGLRWKSLPDVHDAV